MLVTFLDPIGEYISIEANDVNRLEQLIVDNIPYVRIYFYGSSNLLVPGRVPQISNCINNAKAL